MSVLDLYLPDDLAIDADWELGSTLAGIVDAETPGGECIVYVHRLHTYAVVTASVEGARTVRVQLSCAGAHTGLGSRLEAAVRDYLRSKWADFPTRILVTGAG